MPKKYKIGYRKPPKRTQFRKGQSGNPSGRPKNTKNFKTDLLEELSEQIAIQERGHSLTISKQRAMIKSLIAAALKGDTKASSILLQRLEKIQEEESSDFGGSEKLSDTDNKILNDYIQRLKGENDSKN